MVEEARLESVYTPKGYRRFESYSLRKCFITSGNSSVGRALASQAGGREFEPRLPLGLKIKELSFGLTPFL